MPTEALVEEASRIWGNRGTLATGEHATYHWQYPPSTPAHPPIVAGWKIVLESLRLLIFQEKLKRWIFV